MPPPSPPQAAPPSFTSQRPPPPPQFPTGRDLPSLGSAQRSGGAFSISSILGGAIGSTSSNASAGRRSPPPQPTASSPAGKPMRAPTPPRTSLYNNPRNDYPAWRRPHTPEHIASISGPRPSEPRPFSTQSPRIFGAASTSPEYNHYSTSLHRYSSSHSSERPSDIGSDNRNVHQLWRADPVAPPRPNSQPAPRPGIPPAPPLRDPLDPLRYGPSYYGPSALEQQMARVVEEEHQRVRSISDPRATDRDRPFTTQPLGGSAYSPPASQRFSGAQYSPNHQFRHSPHERAPEVSSLTNGRQRLEEPTTRSPFTGFRAHSAIPPSTAFVNSTSSSPPKQSYTSTPQPLTFGEARHHAGGPFSRAVDTYSSRPTNGFDMRAEEILAPTANNQPRSIPYEHAASRIGEEIQQQRSYLNVSPETIRKGQLGRASPLPQAVQGAQAQHKGPGADPSIKNEFGRMFSGLGSGLGSGPGGNGVSTPSRGSPLPQTRPDNLDSNSVTDLDLQMVRSGSRGMKKNRRLKDEEGRADSELVERAGTPSGVKRAKHTQPTAHHHHPHSHQYVFCKMFSSFKITNCG